MAPNLVLSKCPNCGGIIQDTIISPLSVCAYCGAKLAGQREVSANLETYVAKKRIGEDGLNPAIAKWVAESQLEDEATVNLGDISLLWTRLAYHPAYIYRGTVNAEWQLERDANISGTITDDFRVHAYGRKAPTATVDADEDDDHSNFVSKYWAKAVNHAVLDDHDIAPLNGVEALSETYFEFAIDDDTAWKQRGRTAAKYQLETKLATGEYRAAANGEATLKGKTDFDITERAKIFIPAWDICFLYDDEKHYLALDAMAGNGFGDEIYPIDPQYSGKEGIEKHLKPIYFIGLWMLWGIARGVLFPKDSVFYYDSSYFDNALISKVGENLWVGRQLVVFAIIFVGTFIAKKIIKHKPQTGIKRVPKQNRSSLAGKRRSDDLTTEDSDDDDDE